MEGAIEFTFHAEPQPNRTGGAYRTVDVSITLDSRDEPDEQFHSACAELLSAWIDPTECQQEKIFLMADSILEAHRFVFEDSQEGT